jgi:membrane protein YdbS with pleckstrin-like domain
LIFPRIFRLASVLSALTIATGLVLTIGFSRGNLEIFVATAWGRAIFAGGALGLLLTLFHFFIEQRLSRFLASRGEASPGFTVDELHHRLRVIPRIGLVVLIVIFWLMMYAARRI